MEASDAAGGDSGFSVEHLQLAVVYALAVVPLALAYGAGFVLLWQAGAERWLRVFAPVGRMALSNYLSHSLFYAAIFTGLGLGLMGRLTPLTIYAIGLAIFAWQLSSSRLWLQRFLFGPMEWLWRSLTYGRRMPFLRSGR